MAVTVDEMIKEVEYELRQRRFVYSHIVHKSPNRKPELDLHVEKMTAVLDYLLARRWES
jgi:hypothetical protein